MELPVGLIESERARLISIACRILGSNDEAEDVVQIAALRLSSAEGVENPAAWLTTVVTRLCLDRLRRQGTRSRAETAASFTAADPAVDPEEDTLVADRVGNAMQVVLDQLTPTERAAFVLHDVFGYPFDEISEVMGRSATAVRQLASRGRRKVQGRSESPSELVARTENREVVDAFLHAARGGDVSKLLSLLAPDAFMKVDRVGQEMGAPPLFDGADAVAARFDGAKGATPTTIDGELGAAWFVQSAPKVAFVFHVADGLVREIELIADPDVLATMETVRVRRGR